PLLEYGAEVWSTLPWSGAERLQAQVAKRILQVPIRSSSTACLGELGWQTLEARWQQLRVSFWGKLQRMPGDAPARQVYDASRAFYDRHATEADAVQPAAAEEG